MFVYNNTLFLSSAIYYSILVVTMLSLIIFFLNKTTSLFSFQYWKYCWSRWVSKNNNFEYEDNLKGTIDPTFRALTLLLFVAGFVLIYIGYEITTLDIIFLLANTDYCLHEIQSRTIMVVIFEHILFCVWFYRLHSAFTSSSYAIPIVGIRIMYAFIITTMLILSALGAIIIKNQHLQITVDFPSMQSFWKKNGKLDESSFIMCGVPLGTKGFQLLVTMVLLVIIVYNSVFCWLFIRKLYALIGAAYKAENSATTTDKQTSLNDNRSDDKNSINQNSNQNVTADNYNNLGSPTSSVGGHDITFPAASENNQSHDNNNDENKKKHMAKSNVKVYRSDFDRLYYVSEKYATLTVISVLITFTLWIIEAFVNHNFISPIDLDVLISSYFVLLMFNFGDSHYEKLVKCCPIGKIIVCCLQRLQMNDQNKGQEVKERKFSGSDKNRNVELVVNEA